MSRLLLLIAIAAAVYLMIKFYRKNKPRQDAKIAEDMVCCAHCGMHLPKGESIREGGRFFCSKEHRDEYSE